MKRLLITIAVLALFISSAWAENKFTGNPIILDDFSAPIDVGMERWGQSEIWFSIQAIEWQIPMGTTHVAVITDADGRDIFRQKCTTTKSSIVEYWNGAKVKGIKIHGPCYGTPKEYVPGGIETIDQWLWPVDPSTQPNHPDVYGVPSGKIKIILSNE